MDDPEKLAEFADHLGVAVERLLAVVKTPYYYAEDISNATRMVEDQLRCRVMLRAHEIPHLRTIAHMPQGADKLPSTIQETKVGMLTGSNKDLLSLLASDGQRLKPEIQRGVLELYRKLGRAGLAWEDGRLENMYYLERAEGSWEAGVLDLDRIMPWKDVTNPHFARTHEDMVMIQYAPGFDSYRPLASLVSQTLPQTYAGGNVWPSAAFFNEKMLERWGYITYNRETGLWSGERFDLAIVEEYFPEFRKHVDIDWNKGTE